MIPTYILIFILSIALSWIIFYIIKKSTHYELYLNFAFLILVGSISAFASFFTGEKWILYLLIPEVAIFVAGLARDMKKIGNIINALIQLAIFISVYLFMGISISSLKDPFSGHSVSLGIFSPLIFLIWMFVITNSLAITSKIKNLLFGILIISSLVLFMTSSNVFPVSLIFVAFLGIFAVSFIQSLSADNFNLGTSASQLIGFVFATLAIKGASLSATSVVLFVPLIFFLMLSLQKVYSFFKHNNGILQRTFLTPERIESKLISLGFTRNEFVLSSLILTLVLSVFDIIFRHNPQLVAVATYVIMIILILAVLRLFIFIRDYKDGDKRGKRIYVVNQYYHSDNAATGEVLKDLCEAFAQDGYDVVVLSSRSSFSDPKSEIINGVHVERLCVIPKGHSLITKARGYATYFFWVWFRFLKVRRNSIILVLTTPPLVAVVPILWKPFKEFRVVYDIQDLYPDALKSLNMVKEKSVTYRWLSKIQRSLLLKSDYVVAIGKTMKEKICSTYGISPNKVAVIQNFALKELKYFSDKQLKIESSYLPNKDAFVVQYSGNFGRAHEYETILNAMRLMWKQGIGDVKFQFKGDGFNYKKLRAIAKKEKLENAEFLPFVERNELAQSLSYADVSLVISKKEFAGVIFPSKFYGVIAVAKPILYIFDGEDDIKEYIDKYKIGYVIPNGKSEELVEKILFLKSHSEVLKEFSLNALKLHKMFVTELNSIERYEILFKKMGEMNYERRPISEFLSSE